MSLIRRRRDDVAEPSPVVPAGPVTRETVAQTLPAGVAENLLPAVRLTIKKEPDAGIDVGRSKLGGAPDLPRGVFWPRWEAPGGEKLLQFFAQVELSEVAAAAPSELGLPRDGVLSFFADFDAATGVVPGPEASAVVYSPADALLIRHGLRMEPVPTAELHPVGTWTLPAPLPAAFGDERDADVRARVPEHYHLSGSHQVGGHAPGVDGVVVLQFDSDDVLELSWKPDGGRGRLVWTIPADELAARNWASARMLVLD